MSRSSRNPQAMLSYRETFSSDQPELLLSSGSCRIPSFASTGGQLLQCRFAKKLSAAWGWRSISRAEFGSRKPVALVGIMQDSRSAKQSTEGSPEAIPMEGECPTLRSGREGCLGEMGGRESTGVPGRKGGKDNGQSR